MSRIEFEVEYRCEACGRLTTVLNETDDFIWVCTDCFCLYNRSFSNPDCVLEEE